MCRRVYFPLRACRWRFRDSPPVLTSCDITLSALHPTIRNRSLSPVPYRATFREDGPQVALELRLLCLPEGALDRVLPVRGLLFHDQVLNQQEAGFLRGCQALLHSLA